MSNYQGHNADGSSIQNHSCGETYPYVIGYTERGGYAVIPPGGDWLHMGTFKAAYDLAIGFKVLDEHRKRQRH